jgi:NAD(P)-dependent dehydrogenase (short-subunit alcohol dehydrogenase family)
MGLLKEKVIVLTGGAGLLGKAFSKAIAAQGGGAVVTDINMNHAAACADEINKSDLSGKAYAVYMDITSHESIQAAISQIEEKTGKVDALVNCAYPRNSLYGKRLEDVSYQSFCENVSIHLGGYFSATKEFALYFKSKGMGNIISISSIYGSVAPRFDIYEGTSMTMPVEYAAIKAGVQQMMKYMVKYFKGYNIRFNCLSPGGILDKQPAEFLQKYKKYSQSKGMLEPNDVIGTLIFLLSDLSVYMNGQNLTVDDGWSL